MPQLHPPSSTLTLSSAVTACSDPIPQELILSFSELLLELHLAHSNEKKYGQGYQSLDGYLKDRLTNLAAEARSQRWQNRRFQSECWHEFEVDSPQDAHPDLCNFSVSTPFGKPNTPRMDGVSWPRAGKGLGIVPVSPRLPAAHDPLTDLVLRAPFEDGAQIPQITAGKDTVARTPVDLEKINLQASLGDGAQVPPSIPENGIMPKTVSDYSFQYPTVSETPVNGCRVESDSSTMNVRRRAQAPSITTSRESSNTTRHLSPTTGTTGSATRKSLRTLSTSSSQELSKKRLETVMISQFIHGDCATTHLMMSDSVLARIVFHPCFDGLCATMIVLNAIIAGYSVEWLASHDREPLFLKIAGNVVSCFFIIELILRIYLRRLSYFLESDRLWNIFDVLLVLCSIVEYVLDWFAVDGDWSLGSSLKTIKMLRILRIFRVIRFFHELALLALMIADSCKSLVWALAMLSIIVYVFAVCFTSLATTHIENTDATKSNLSAITEHWSTLGRATRTLIESMLGGVSWGEVLDPLIPVGYFATGLFFLFVFFTMLAVLNVITGVFVDRALLAANSRRDIAMMKDLEVREGFMEEMGTLFALMDSGNTGIIFQKDMVRFLGDARCQAYLAALGLESSDVARLFDLIDVDRSGAVDREEFLGGCVRLKGTARSIDVHHVLCSCKSISNDVHKLLSHFSLPAIKKTRASNPALIPTPTSQSKPLGP